MTRTAENSGNRRDGGTVTDARLIETIGLFRTPPDPVPGTDDGDSGQHRRLIRTALLVGFWTMFTTIVLHTGSLYLATNDFQWFAYLIMLHTISGICAVKARALLTDAHLFRAVVLDLGRYTFTSCGRRDPSVLRRCRATLDALLGTFVLINYSGFAVWIMMPLFVRQRLSVTLLDGTVSEFRMSVLNLWVPVFSAAYNSPATWPLAYAYEIFIAFLNFGAWVLFDCYLMSACAGLNAHFRTLAAGYEALGRRSPLPSDLAHTLSPGDRHYYDLIRLIQDNKNILKKHDEFYYTVRTAVILQIASGSGTGILAIFFIALMCLSGLSFLSAPVIKIVLLYVVVALQMGVYCYMFSIVETAKSAVNFGLYSSDWTAMDLQFKKTLLMAMQMNSCHKRIARLTPTRVINLEMVSTVLKTSYSVVSLLLHMTVKQTVKK